MIKYLSSIGILGAMYATSLQPDKVWLFIGLSALVLTDYLRRD